MLAHCSTQLGVIQCIVNQEGQDRRDPVLLVRKKRHVVEGMACIEVVSETRLSCNSNRCADASHQPKTRGATEQGTNMSTAEHEP